MYNRAAMARRRNDGQMPSLEERVAYLEGRLEDHTTAVSSLRSDVQDVREGLRQLGERVDRLWGRVDQLAERMDRRFDTLDEKVDRHFAWLVGVQVATLVAVVGALAGGYYR